jgi:hypothetical protein
VAAMAKGLMLDALERPMTGAGALLISVGIHGTFFRSIEIRWNARWPIVKIFRDQMTIAPKRTTGFKTPRSMKRFDDVGEKALAPTSPARHF